MYGGDPHGSGLVVRAVPDATAPGDLVLPLLQRLALHLFGPETFFSLACRGLRRRGSLVMLFQALLVLADAALASSSHSRAAWLLANRMSHPPFSGGGATRSLRLGIGAQTAGMGTGSPDTDAMGSASRRHRSGSAWTAAVAFQSHSA